VHLPETEKPSSRGGDAALTCENPAVPFCERQEYSYTPEVLSLLGREPSRGVVLFLYTRLRRDRGRQSLPDDVVPGLIKMGSIDR
jgi:hypothetical protein